MQEIIISWFTGMPKELATFLMAMLPITELRASIPVAILKYGLSPFSAFFWSVLGNAFLGVLALLLIEPVTKLIIEKNNFLDKMWQKYIGKLRGKNKDKFAKWEAWALVSFVAIPLPMTGAFSGAVAASIFQIKSKKAIPLITLGCLISGTIVTTLIILGKNFTN
ncbi:MAG TPA: ligand-binding protein SH3 [Candidatus Moranbacteria bacterium]|nr:ligand-binding protein SH3 [Candidatus Moranbacteria bacterium]